MSKAGEFQSSEIEQMKELTEELSLVTKLKKLSSSLTTIEVPNIMYTYKFLRDVNFAVFAGNLSSSKFKPSEFYKTVVIHLKYKV